MESQANKKGSALRCFATKSTVNYLHRLIEIYIFRYDNTILKYVLHNIGKSEKFDFLALSWSFLVSKAVLPSKKRIRKQTLFSCSHLYLLQSLCHYLRRITDCHIGR